LPRKKKPPAGTSNDLHPCPKIADWFSSPAVWKGGFGEKKEKGGGKRETTGLLGMHLTGYFPFSLYARTSYWLGPAWKKGERRGGPTPEKKKKKGKKEKKEERRGSESGSSSAMSILL